MAYSCAGRRTLTPLFTRTRILLSSSSSSSFSRCRFSIPLLNDLAHRAESLPCPGAVPTRPKTSWSGRWSLDDLSRKWNKWLWEDEETTRFESCVKKSWIIIMEFPDPKPSSSEMVKIYIKTLASVVGSEEEARKRIYSVRTTKNAEFRCLISEELSDKMKDLPGVRCVFPDPDRSCIEYL